MNTPRTQKLAIMGLVLLTLVFFGYNLFIKDSNIPTESANQYSIGVGEDILVLIEKLKTISIDKSLFSSALFINLIDLSTSLYPEQQGRPNPFALIGI